MKIIIENLEREKDGNQRHFTGISI